MKAVVSCQAAAVADYQNYAVQYPGQYNRPPTPPTPSDRSASPPPSHRIPGRRDPARGYMAVSEILNSPFY